MVVLARVFGKVIILRNVVADLPIAWNGLYFAAHQRFVFFKLDQAIVFPVHLALIKIIMCIYDKCFCAHNFLTCLLHGLFEGRFECRPIMAAKLANLLIDDRFRAFFLHLLTKLFMLHLMHHFIQSLL